MQDVAIAERARCGGQGSQCGWRHGVGHSVRRAHLLRSARRRTTAGRAPVSTRSSSHPPHAGAAPNRRPATSPEQHWHPHRRRDAPVGTHWWRFGESGRGVRAL